jgi:hypothetical protein
LLDLYRTALLQEDIDQLDALLQPEAAGGSRARLPQQPQANGTAPTEVETFREERSTAFRNQTLVDLRIPPETVQVAAVPQSVTFQEVETLEEPEGAVTRTRVYQTTWQLVQDEVAGVITVRIAGIQRTGPLVEIVTRGQVQAAALTRLEVLPGMFPLAAGTVTVPETGTRSELVAHEELFSGLFLPPPSAPPQPLRVELRGQNSTVLEILHPYRLRRVSEPTVQPLAVDTAFFAVAVDAQGTVWAGGSGTRPGTFGTLVEVAANGRILQRREFAPAPEDEPLPQDAQGRIEDIAVDQQGRLHLLFFARTEEGIVANGDVVWDPQFPDLFCQTVNAFDAAYPLLSQDPESQRLRPSPSTRVTAAGGAEVWLAGSDGGVARVADLFRNGQCPAGVLVDYGPVYRRETSPLLANTVPAVVVSTNETLWLGTALGLQRVQGNQWNPLPLYP